MRISCVYSLNSHFCQPSKKLVTTMAASNPPSGTSTPRAFTSQTASAEDLLKSQTVGLVNLADFRKRRADVLELKEKEAREGARTPDSDG